VPDLTQPCDSDTAPCVRTVVVRLLAVSLLLAAACGDRTGRLPDAPTASGDAGDDANVTDADVTDAGADAMIDAMIDAPPMPDAFPAVLNVGIDCHNTCVLTANPPAINVQAGTGFEVNWINVGDTDCDVAKIDQFNQVPIIIGLQPGTSYHDSVRTWCGQFTGTFNFRVSICTIHSYIPVNCNAP
jgi:hypothetical protein